MEYSVRPRSSKLLRTPTKQLKSKSNCKARSIASGAMSPASKVLNQLPSQHSNNGNNNSGFLRGTVKSLAIGSLTRPFGSSHGVSPTQSTDSPAEVTVSLSRSSWTSSSHQSLEGGISDFDEPRNPSQPMRPPISSQAPLHLSRHLFANYDDTHRSSSANPNSQAHTPYYDDEDTFFDPYLDYTRRRPVKEEPQIPQNNVVEDSLDVHPFDNRKSRYNDDGDDDHDDYDNCDDDFRTACGEEATIVGTQVRGALPPPSPRRSKSLIAASFPDHRSSLSASKMVERNQRRGSPTTPAMVSPSTNNSTDSGYKTTTTNNLSRSGRSSQTTDSERSLRFGKEKKYWNEVVTDRTMTLGSLHPQTAEAFFSLGQSHLRLNEFKEAMQAFQSSGKIWKALKGSSDLSVARALDAYGLAALRYHNHKSRTALVHARKALEEAFAIRFQHLGVWHVDTVETFNKLSSVKLYQGHVREACQGYEEVFLLRKAIFGRNHASVAVSAHGLAKVHLQLSNFHQAQQFFLVAYEIYQTMHLPEDHLTVRRLLHDWKGLDKAQAKAEAKS